MDYPNSTVGSATTPEDFGRGGRGEVRRWAAEIGLAKDAKRDYMDQAKKVWERYRAKNQRKNAYNCLYANTSILFPEIYNTLPNPDISRRYDRDDPLGKAVSEVWSRAIKFNNETTNFDGQVRMDVLDMLVVAMGVSRVRYVPDLVQVGDIEGTGAEENESELGHEAQQGEAVEELNWETAPIEHIQWDQWLHGPGRTWDLVPWVGFIHKLTRDELIERFGEEIGNAIELDSSVSHDKQQKNNGGDETYDLFKTATVYEIWDKDERKVKWINLGYVAGPLKTEDDPYGFDNFFPMPEPIIAIVDSDIQRPVMLFEQYSQQADELDKISARINRIVDAIKARAIYDPSLGNQIAELFRGEDNDLIPAGADVRALYDIGGIEKAIWFMPIEKLAAIVAGLYAARDQCKAVIYELSGISDIMRGSTDANETLGAQGLKVAFGTSRISDMQRNVQRYVRDLIRMQAHIIAGFDLETLKKVTECDYPTNAQYAAQIAPIVQQYQQAVMQAAITGQPVPPKPQMPPKPVTWEDIDAVLKSEQIRTYKIDIETDSTIAATLQQDMQSLTESVTAIVGVFKELGPIVQTGALPLPALKELVLIIARKCKLGNSLEDVFDKIQQPPPPQDPNASKLQAQAQMKQMELQAETAQHDKQMQADMAMEKFKAMLDQQTAAWTQEYQARENAHQQALELQRDDMQFKQEQALKQYEATQQRSLDEMKQMIQLLISREKNATTLEAAQIAAGTQLATSQIAAAQQASKEE